MHTDYLILGASHAALSALNAIRMHDADGGITLVTRDDCLPYSPTVLPYVVSGRSQPQRVFLKNEDYFARSRAELLRGAAVAAVDGAGSRAHLADGRTIAYRKLLVATGAAPVVPPIPGLRDSRFHVLRTLDDALALKSALGRARQAVVLGAGLVGMHAAENLAKTGAAVTVVEMQPHVLPGYFDAQAAAIIESAFRKRGVMLLTGHKVVRVEPAGSGCTVCLEAGETIAADLLLVGVGVAPVTDFLAGTGVEVDRGVLVDDTMRTSVDNIWAAGDVAQARSFYSDARTVNGILPNAVEQGRVAGMAMAGDPGLRPYPGGVPLNTYTFFGQRAVSVGIQEQGVDGAEVYAETDPDGCRHLKVVLKDDRLLGIFGINAAFDPGVMWELVLRRVDLGPVKTDFLVRPQETARALMSRLWR
ncbi:MAG: NADH-dependent phenylglyoxylate dehydrogenase subunit epsilon [Pseudomonadota bacterium]|jgi:phenylglyoxylate dehydrogenase epsilon subunit